MKKKEFYACLIVVLIFNLLLFGNGCSTMAKYHTVLKEIPEIGVDSATYHRSDMFTTGAITIQNARIEIIKGQRWLVIEKVNYTGKYLIPVWPFTIEFNVDQYQRLLPDLE